MPFGRWGGLMGNDMSNDDNFGPWIDWAGGECPVGDETLVHVKIRRGVDRHWLAGNFFLRQWDWKGFEPLPSDIIAYRVRLPADDLLRQAIEALRDVTNALESKIDTSEKFKRPYEHPLSAFDRARAVLTAYDKSEQL